MNRKICCAALGAALAGTFSALACGPWYPNRLLEDGAKELLRAPVSNFEWELRRLRPEQSTAALRAKPPKEGDYHQQTADADAADLREALDHPSAGTPPLAANARVTLLTDYAAVRQTLRDNTDAGSETLAQAAAAVAAYPHRGDELRAIVLPKDLPGEFADYLQGAIAFYLNDRAAARAAWEKLLARPENERHFRSTWAAYMLGRLSLYEEQPADAIKWFEKTRTLAGQDCADSLGLAAASLGWQAGAEFDAGAQAAGMTFYVDQAATGDGTAVDSLRWACSDVFDNHPVEELAKLAANDDARRVLTAYLVARNNSSEPLDKTRMSAWLAAIDAANLGKVEEADRFALLAYQHGEFDLAARWLERAPADALMAMWLRAKLELRAGHIEKAAEWMAKVVRVVPDDTAADDPESAGTPEAKRTHSQHRQAHGEYAALQLGRADFAAALDGLLRARFWRDAAYVAERVLTAEELRAYVDANWPEAPGQSPSDSFLYEKPEWYNLIGSVQSDEEGASIRYLLARRLARLGRFDEADPYYPPALAPLFKAYVQAWRDGHDAKVSQPRRAWALWMAAKIARHEGLQLLGTEVEPDWATFAGDFQEERLSMVRARDLKPPQPASAAAISEFFEEQEWNHPRKELTLIRNNQILPPTAEEQRRLDANPTIPENRWHYRYIAADLAWEAALLLPNNQESTARVLCAAGSWLKGHDPLTADRFYQAIERRCPETPLGKEAVTRRWFPPDTPEP